MGPQPPADAKKVNVHQQLLQLAAQHQEQRRASFLAVKTRADLKALQKSLRDKIIRFWEAYQSAMAHHPER